MIFGRFKITGHSMQPAFNPGDQVITWNFPKIKKNDVIVFKYQEKYLLKRVNKILNNTYFVSGDNKLDSLSTPSVKKSDIIGKVIFKI